VFLEYLSEPVSQWFGPGALPSNDKDLVANRALARGRVADLKSAYQLRFLSHASCCHKLTHRILSL